MADADSELPRFAQDRVNQAMPRGVVENIRVRPERRAPNVEVDAWDLSSAQDHARPGDRAVTLFQHEHLAVISGFIGRPVGFHQTRRNVCIAGFNLEVARGRVIEVGETLLRLTGRCHPCARMEETIGPGGFVAMFGHGGWTASIVRTGTIRRGDTVRLGDAEQL